MRTFTVLSITFILTACLLAGCGGDDDDDSDIILPDDSYIVGPDEADGVYLGLTSIKAGSWATYTGSEGEQYTLEYHGTDTYDGKSCFVIELEIGSGAGAVITQLWAEKATGESVLYVMKQGALLIKLDVSQVPEEAGYVVESEEDDSSDAVKVRVESYTTPTNKTVEATVYLENGDESWISTEVPFGLVKSTYNGEVDSELYDFGSSGATRSISKEEAEHAEALNIPDLE